MVQPLPGALHNSKASEAVGDYTVSNMNVAAERFQKCDSSHTYSTRMYRRSVQFQSGDKGGSKELHVLTLR